MSRRSGIMLCYPFEEKRLAKWPRPYIVQPKLDGTRCRAVPTEDGWKMLTSEENPIISCPHILNELNSIPRHLWMELDGELYTHGLTFEQISSPVRRTTNLHEDHEQIQFHVFDMVSETLPQYSRFHLLEGFFKQTTLKHIKKVPTDVAATIHGIMNCMEEFINEGYEGIIVRNLDGLYKRKRSTDIMKFKPRKSDWYEIIGYKEEVDKHGVPKNRLGALICKGDDETEFSVGSGFTAKQRHDYWLFKESLVGYYVRVNYQHITPGKGVPRFPIFVDLEPASGELS